MDSYVFISGVKNIVSLVDDLYKMTKLDYLSDMHLRCNWKIIGDAVKKIPEDRYPKEEWIEACLYITGSCNVKDYVKSDLLNRLYLESGHKVIYSLNEEGAGYW